LRSAHRESFSGFANWRLSSAIKADLTSRRHSAEQHYPCMSDDGIKALLVARLAAEDWALFLWGIWPKNAGRNRRANNSR
jgi:hypothetical protein